MIKDSAGILVFKKIDGKIYVLLVHPGGPIWGPKDNWTIPKGQIEAGESMIDAARREFREEVGLEVPSGELYDLGEIKKSSNKTNHIWAVAGEIDVSKFSSNLFSLEWPPHSGIIQNFPEGDKAEWFEVNIAKSKIIKSQSGFLDRLETLILN